MVRQNEREREKRIKPLQRCRDNKFQLIKFKISNHFIVLQYSHTTLKFLTLQSYFPLSFLPCCSPTPPPSFLFPPPPPSVIETSPPSRSPNPGPVRWNGAAPSVVPARNVTAAKPLRIMPALRPSGFAPVILPSGGLMKTGEEERREKKREERMRMRFISADFKL